MSIENAIQLIKQLHNHGYEAYIVGGFVRDKLLGRSLGDIDIATSASPEEVQRIFNKTIPVGIVHGTVIVRWKKQSYEVTTFRSDGEYSDYRHPTEVHFHDSIEQDLARRDFTMNAMAQEINGSILDPFGGKKDIEERLIRAVGVSAERFQEDPLRMMRAIRFVSLLGFQIEERTKQALIEQAFLLEKVSTERIRDEFEKLLLGDYCQKAMQLLWKSNVYQFFPGGSFNQLHECIEKDWSKLASIEERWAATALCLKIEHVKPWLKAWKLPNQKLNHVITYINLVKTADDIRSDWNLYIYGWEAIEAVFRLRVFFGIVHTKEIDRHDLTDRYKRLPIHDRNDLAVNGNSLQSMFQRKPGPWIGKVMSEIERNVVEGRLTNELPAIKEWIQQWDRRQENN
ncbi:CCA tRNA nucleotidyltransferase [Alkalihalobacillus sp. AL-G]|uniref:CCA tRNA nucleotidyltransferase n=1 Tax=Alkalihalobacillus sp. AL-G TaxID=2926399 RepID=UPI00272D8876|nr:CCA tRNA nucleotidyltransferase [Alkalihalobacillus sp. AL-G]WLD91801.1 CCA tRNA nucleotidyltransferase [Alkalihalobacillus sp. AL-G]